MPFVKKSVSKHYHASVDARRLFVGRVNELQFFVESILKSEEPSHNILSIWGQGGVGKSFLLARFIEEAEASDFKDYCLTAYVDEQQKTLVNIMERLAAQLHMTGEFEKAVDRYKESLRKLQYDRELAKDAFWQKTATNVAGAAVEGVPIVGGILKEGVGPAVEYLLAERRSHRLLEDAKRLEDPVGDLTEAFVKELNALADTWISLGNDRRKHQRRVILFFDTFEQLAPEVVPWLLDSFLEVEVSANVVLVVAGRSPIERSTPENPARWLPYLENNTIYHMPLESFTEDETHTYLISRGITEADRIATIWQLSQGLPLYLVWTAHSQGTIDPTADVVVNFLQWIPKQELSKRKLVLDAALCSRPFNQDDLEAFSYVSEQERPVLYDWLTTQPFVHGNPQDGRYSYHEVAQELFSRYLSQRSPNEYHATRGALVAHYQRLLTHAETTEGEDVYASAQWLELTLALAHQLFLLPDEASHIQAIEQVLNAYDVQTEQAGQISRFLRDLLRAQLDNQRNTGMRQTVEQLLRYIEACEDQRILRRERNKQELLSVADYFIEKVAHHSSFSREVLASLYCWRGQAYHELRNYKQALADCNRAIKLDPANATYYDIRGYVYLTRGDYQQTIANYDRAIKLDPSNAAYYTERGRAYREIKDYDRALADQNRALDLDSQLAWGYVSRGFTYLWRNDRKDIERALNDLLQSWELRPTDPAIGLTGLYVQWCRICQEQATLEVAEQLEKIATFDAKSCEAYVCRGIALWICRLLEEAVAEYEKAIQLDPENYDAYFWKGMACASLGRDEEAMATIERALELGLPPVLLTPLRWLEQDRHDFYEKYVVPLLAQYKVEVSEQ